MDGAQLHSELGDAHLLRNRYFGVYVLVVVVFELYDGGAGVGVLSHLLLEQTFPLL